jgi:putative ABC transport system substrate-binding protein
MDRRRFLQTALAGTLVTAPLASNAQGAKPPRIGLLLPGTPGPLYDRWFDAFRDGLRDFGFIEKQNIVLEYRFARGRYEHLPELVADLISLGVDVLVIDGQPAGEAAKSATRTIPIVLAVAGDAVGTGLVESLARPGGNITGTTLMTPDLSAKRLALLKEAIPKAATVAVLRNPDNAASQVYWRELQGAAPKLQVQLQPVEVRRSTDLESALSTIAGWRVDALLIIEDPVLVPLFRKIADFTARRRLPTISGLRPLVDAGGLMSFGPNFPDLFRNAATFVVKILRGAKPSELPIEQPSTFELVINLKTAKALGLTIPPSLLLRADQVIE